MKNPQFVSILQRKLKPDCTYDDFYQAWLPPDLNGKDPQKEPVGYFNAPVQVINAINTADPTDIISIGLIWGNQEDVDKDVVRTKEIESKRNEKILTVADKIGKTKFYRIEDINLLGTALPVNTEE